MIKRRTIFFGILAAVLTSALFFLYLYPKQSPLEFTKEGKVSFIDSEESKINIIIDIELAKTEEEIKQGLMHRSSLPENSGMLFIFPDENIRFFWMKNTYIPLDIIFADSQGKIITIRENTLLRSETLISSEGKAKYVLEVQAGFSKKHNIRVGNYFTYLGL